MEESLRILQVSTSDGGGGAEKIAWDLHRAYRARGYHTWLAVGHKRTDGPHMLVLPNDAYRDPWAKIWIKAGNLLSPLVGRVRGAGRLQHWLRLFGQPRRWLEIWRGHEDFDFPATWHLLDPASEKPDVLHCHNLHGGYFDLQALPRLSHEVPTVLTLHDAWLLSGHCIHSFDCERWKRGCGHCPDLAIYPAIRRDATAYNWRRKREIYAKSRLFVVTPSRWLMQKVEQSMLAPAVVEARIIPYGVDLSVFRPGDREAVRPTLGIPQDAKVLLFAANGIRRNVFKDYQTMRAAVALVAERLHGQGVLFIALGEDAPAEQIGQAEVRFVPYQKDSEAVARYYQAADVYVHAARADTFPNTVLEALACGTPVVATAVGGIPEQIEDGVTGFLTPPGSAAVMADCIVTLLADDNLHRRLSHNAAETARRRFDLERQADEYLAWYQELVETHGIQR